MANGPRKAIWTFADVDLTSDQVYAGNNLIDHVKAEFFCQDSGDTGAITFSSLSSKAPGGPYVCQNTVSQVIVNSTIAHSSLQNSFLPNGVFCDDETDGQILTNVQVTNTQATSTQFRQNNSSGHILTNTSFNSDGSVNGSFNPALMDTANIGITDEFPY